MAAPGEPRRPETGVVGWTARGRVVVGMMAVLAGLLVASRAGFSAAVLTAAAAIGAVVVAVALYLLPAVGSDDEGSGR